MCFLLSVPLLLLARVRVDLLFALTAISALISPADFLQ
jgi:hypothetical protein